MYWNFSGILIGHQDARLSARGCRVILEIGFGNGEYLEHLARTRPDALIVGVEASQWCVTKAARRALAAGLHNVRLMLGDARHLLSLAFEPCCVFEAYMNFPCPWPKRRHAGRRVAQPWFADLIASRLAAGGTFTLATDVGWYAEETREIFAASGLFEVSPVLVNPERDYATKYERKWRAMGRDTYMTTARKTAESGGDGVNAADDLPLEEELTTPARGDIGDRAMSLMGEEISGPGYRVIFREVFSSMDGETLLVMAISVDEGFEQHYYIRMTPAANVVKCRTDPVGSPYRTPGVRASLRYVARKIAGRPDDSV
ncbi:MAG: methyltransferase domain-containing protein [Synergistaceae bacterium]|jgi:tRNA (guanine-N7-)-methyltransferase|nr:methyltransferase domain-containing protein [Synergistaceae bacterium]